MKNRRNTKYYNLISLGCSKNLVDSEIFAGVIERADYKYTDRAEFADTIIVNTCGFVQSAVKEAIETILEVAEYKKIGRCKKLIVTGCFVKRYFAQIKCDIPEIDHLVNLKDFKKFAKIFNQEEKYERKLLTPTHIAFLRIADGCNNHCSYCTIPSIRGNLQSRSLHSLLQEAEKLSESGVKELILTAQDTCMYGVDLYGEPKLIELLEQLNEIKKLEWIRVLYLHPDHISKEIIDTIHDIPKVCNYFELPIQHINERILDSMNRKRKKQELLNILKMIRKKESVIRTTLITGYPRETEKEFSEVHEFVKSVQFDRLGVFPYSKEDGTKASKIKPLISNEVAKQRKEKIMATQQKISQKLLKRFLRKKLKVIVDKSISNKSYNYIGRTQFDTPDIDGVVYLSGKTKSGDICECKIIDTGNYDLFGKIEQKDKLTE